MNENRDPQQPELDSTGGAVVSSEAVVEQAEAEEVDFRQSLVALSTVATGHISLPSLLTRVAQLAVHAIPGADGAGLTLLQKGRPDTIVATADIVRAVDDIQYGIGEGPCIMAAAQGLTVRSGSLGAHGTWPRFGPRVSALGVHSALSLPLIGSKGVLGAMNVCAHAHDAFDDRAAELGELYAAPAAISVQNAQVLAQAHSLAAQLETAMATRAVIDHAMGVLVARTGCSSVQAFAKLRAMSQSENRKLSVVAQRLLDEAVRRARAAHINN